MRRFVRYTKGRQVSCDYLAWVRERILVPFVRLFDLVFGFVCFLFLLVSGKGCGLWLWHSLDFSLNFFFVNVTTNPSEISKNLLPSVPLANTISEASMAGTCTSSRSSWTFASNYWYLFLLKLVIGISDAIAPFSAGIVMLWYTSLVDDSRTSLCLIHR